MLVGDTKSERKDNITGGPLPSLGSSDKAKGREGWDEILAKSLPLSLLGGSEKSQTEPWGGGNKVRICEAEGNGLSPTPLKGMGTSGLFRSINLKGCSGCWRQQH